ncbi:MAG: hypothetical protein ACRD45_19065 [Bryobacteraceae bacterium]
MLSATKERYNFQIYPKTIEEMNEQDAKGIVFEGGSFPFGDKHYTIAKVTTYGDGIVVDSGLSTDLSEAFLADVLSFLSSEFGLTYRPEMIYRKIYTSELIVRTDKDLDGLFSRLSGVREKLRLLTGQDFQPAGFGFSIDLTVTTARSAAFRFERELNKPFDQHRYYSSAPLRTSDHEDLLAEMEALL